eukprot:1393407-Amorphochlora_amoeboformis.AAC.1
MSSGISTYRYPPRVSCVHWLTAQRHIPPTATIMARSDLALAVSTAAAASFCLSRAPLRQSVLAGLGTLLLASSARYILRFFSGKHFVVPRKGAILVRREGSLSTGEGGM